MLHSSAIAITTGGKHLTCSGFTPSEIIHFGSLEFIADCFSSLSLSLKGNGSGAIVEGTAHSRSPPLHAIL
jgi:hypothetical protein